MGEMADFYNEQVEEMEDRRFLYRMGDLSDIEAYEEGIIDELGYEHDSKQSKKSLTCKHCHKSPLIWQNILGKWIMFERKDKVHICPKYCPPITILKAIYKEKHKK